LTTETTIEINLPALKKNFSFIRSKLPPKTLMLGVVKACGYGSSPIEVSKLLESLGIDYFAVAYINEGIELRRAGIKSPILVLHPQISNFKKAIEFNLEPSLYSNRVLKAFVELSAQQGLENYPVHVKFNTGLNRLGFDHESSDQVAKKLCQERCLKVKSIFSHLAASEDLGEKTFTELQIENFEKASKKFALSYGKMPIRHLSNTSGVLNYPNANYEMVRCGIGLYGYDNTKENTALCPVVSLKTIISQIHHIKKGGSVGYNRAFFADKDKKIATLPLGHADGIDRKYGNGVGYVLISDNIAPIVGNVCMDMIMVDVSNVSCEEGDEVVVFDSINTAQKLAEKANTISYELLTALSTRIKRKIVE
jgi:alanine racemase